MKARKKIRIAITEDNVYYNAVMKRYLQTICKGLQGKYPDVVFDIQSYHNGEEFIENLEKDLDILLLDYYLTDDTGRKKMNGPDVLKVVNRYCKNCEVIMISEQREILNAVELMKKGIYDYVDKNVNSGNRIGSLVQEIITNKIAA